MIIILRRRSYKKAREQHKGDQKWKIHRKKMKCIVAIFVLYSAALFITATALDLPPELKEIVEAAHGTCRAQTGVDPGVLEKALKGSFSDDPKFKCFLKCMFQELQAMRDDGTVDVDLVEASLPPEVKDRGAMDSLKKCLPPSGKELCQAAFDMVICMHKVNPKLAEIFD